MLLYHPSHNLIQMVSMFLVFQSKLLINLRMALILQQKTTKNHLCMLWGKSTEVRVSNFLTFLRSLTEVTNQSALTEKMEWATVAFLWQEIAVDLNKEYLMFWYVFSPRVLWIALSFSYSKGKRPDANQQDNLWQQQQLPQFHIYTS